MGYGPTELLQEDTVMDMMNNIRFLMFVPTLLAVLLMAAKLLAMLCALLAFRVSLRNPTTRILRLERSVLESILNSPRGMIR